VGRCRDRSLVPGVLAHDQLGERFLGCLSTGWSETRTCLTATMSPPRLGSAEHSEVPPATLAPTRRYRAVAAVMGGAWAAELAGAGIRMYFRD
jgi:hypothetical protein